MDLIISTTFKVVPFTVADISPFKNNVAISDLLGIIDLNNSLHCWLLPYTTTLFSVTVLPYLSVSPTFSPKSANINILANVFFPK